MTLQVFNQLIHDRHDEGTLHDSKGHVRRDILDTFLKNKKNLKDEFFQEVALNLEQGNISTHTLGILTVYPFKEEIDKERFQNLVIKMIEEMESSTNTLNVPEQARYIWMLLDHMLHDWVISDHNVLMTKFRHFRIALCKFELQFNEHILLLYQKLEHFGVK